MAAEHELKFKSLGFFQRLKGIAYCEANRPGLRSKTAAFCF